MISRYSLFVIALKSRKNCQLICLLKTIKGKNIYKSM